MVEHEWVLRRNCSIAPHQLGQIFMLLCAVSLAIAFAFTLRGAWYILCFSVLELSAVGFAFLIYARHATDRETIALVGDYLLIEFFQAGKTSCFKLDLRQARINPLNSGNRLVTLESSGVRVDVGRHLTERKRHEFAQALQHALITSNVVK